MLNSKLYLFCNRVLVSSLCRHIRTDSVLFKQFKKPGVMVDEEPCFSDPGIRHRASMFKDDPKYLDEVAMGESDIDDLDSDFKRAAESYDEHYSEMKRNKARVARIIARNKFFKPPKEPSMLTYNEKQHIKHLHQENPNEWDVKKLSESFPATELIIKKVIKAEWRPASVEVIKRMDEQVARNWELLSQNKLQASSDLIEHCKKFVDRRETLLAQLKNKEFHKLPPIERKVTWQCGEMAKILTQYERQIDQLYQKQLEGNRKKEISGSTGSEIQKSIDPHHMIKQRIEYEQFLQDVKEEDTLVLGGMYEHSEEVTLDFLEDQIHKSARNNKELPLFDKLILDKSVNNKSVSGNSSVQNKCISSEPEKKSLTSEEPDGDSNRPFPINEFLKKSKKKEKGTFKTQKAIGQEDLKKLKRSKKMEAATFNPFEEEEREDFYNISDEKLGSKAIRLEEENISESLEFLDGNKLRLKVRDKQNNEDDEEVKKQKKVKKFVEGENISKPKIELSYKSNEHMEKLRVEKEVDDIAETCFWNDGSKKNKRGKPAVKQAELAELNKSTTSFKDDNYPDKIEIPQKYLGSGKIFKVKDCYYDDKGDFLYRVPGMTK